MDYLIEFLQSYKNEYILATVIIAILRTLSALTALSKYTIFKKIFHII